MFCLFRSSRIVPQLDRFVILFSWIIVLYWLYFAFIEKALMSKLFAGQALLVDLVVGIPLVLAMAVMVYATVYWTIKLLIIFLLPRFVYQVEESIESDDELDELQKQHGEDYWQNDKQAEKDSVSAENASQQKKPDNESSTKSF